MNQPPEQGKPDEPGMPPETAPDAPRAIGLGAEGGMAGSVGGTAPAGAGPGEPGWAKGLRKLYNSVVEEPLPDSFTDLLRKLDGSDDD